MVQYLVEQTKVSVNATCPKKILNFVYGVHEEWLSNAYAIDFSKHCLHTSEKGYVCGRELCE